MLCHWVGEGEPSQEENEAHIKKTEGRTFGYYDLPEDHSTLTVLSFTAGLLGRMRRQLKLLKIETGEKLY